ncbi:MAG: DUF92 domain-containing protein [Thermoplasmata archaeon]
MLPWSLAILGIFATALLALAAVLSRALTPLAGAVAAVFGVVIVVYAGFPYLALLILFVGASALATRYRFEEKRRQNLQEGRGGERGVSNVISHIIIPTGLAVMGGLSSPLLHPATTALLFASALAFGGADTFASEFGVLAGRATSILTGRPVPPGTNGGVSARGEVFALLASVTTALAGFGLFLAFGSPLPNPVLFVLTVTAAGFVACQVDSVLGETLENRGILTKGSTNFLGMLAAVAFAAVVLLLSGGFL